MHEEEPSWSTFLRANVDDAPPFTVSAISNTSNPLVQPAIGLAGVVVAAESVDIDGRAAIALAVDGGDIGRRLAVIEGNTRPAYYLGCIAVFDDKNGKIVTSNNEVRVLKPVAVSPERLGLSTNWMDQGHARLNRPGFPGAYKSELGKRGSGIMPDFPGEKLVIKLWETIAEKWIGSLFKPWQMRREGRVSIELKQQELITMAQAEREVESIRNGNRSVSAPGITPPLALNNSQSKTEGQHLSLSQFTPAIENVLIADIVRREVNVTRALLQAEEALESDPQIPPDAKVSGDWLYRWRDNASQVSTEELQNLWGRLLAGEVKAPGTYSLRTLECLRNLSQQEAEGVSKLSQFVIEGTIYRQAQELLEAQGVDFSTLLYMQQIGILSGVEAIGLEVTWASLDSMKFIRALKCNSVALVVTAENPDLKIKLPIYQLTGVGTQVLGLGRFEPNVAYLEKVAEHLKCQRVEVELAEYTKISPTQIRTFNGRRL
ncbi:MAG: DUF2806 domain-containing protein [Lysobacterales bacterium]